MTIPVSTAVAAITALTAQIRTAVTAGEGVNAPAVGIFIGDEDNRRPNDRIIIGTNVNRVVTHRNFMGGLQQFTLEEKYTISVLCTSYSGDPDGVANMNRAWVLAGYVETAVRTDPTLGNSTLIAVPSGTQGAQSYWTENPTGRQCDITVSVTIDTLN